MGHYNDDLPVIALAELGNLNGVSVDLGNCDLHTCPQRVFKFLFEHLQVSSFSVAVLSEDNSCASGDCLQHIMMAHLSRKVAICFNSEQHTGSRPCTNCNGGDSWDALSRGDSKTYMRQAKVGLHPGYKCSEWDGGCQSQEAASTKEDIPLQIRP